MSTVAAILSFYLGHKFPQSSYRIHEIIYRMHLLHQDVSVVSIYILPMLDFDELIHNKKKSIAIRLTYALNCEDDQLDIYIYVRDRMI